MIETQTKHGIPIELVLMEDSTGDGRLTQIALRGCNRPPVAT